MTPAELAAIADRCAKATPGWSASSDVETLVRADVPALLAEVERLNRMLLDASGQIFELAEENARLRELLQEAVDGHRTNVWASQARAALEGKCPE